MQTSTIYMHGRKRRYPLLRRKKSLPYTYDTRNQTARRHRACKLGEIQKSMNNLATTGHETDSLFEKRWRKEHVWVTAPSKHNSKMGTAQRLLQCLQDDNASYRRPGVESSDAVYMWGTIFNKASVRSAFRQIPNRSQKPQVATAERS